MPTGPPDHARPRRYPRHNGATKESDIHLSSYRVSAKIAVSDKAQAEEFYEGNLGLRSAGARHAATCECACAGRTSLDVYASRAHAGKATATQVGVRLIAQGDAVTRVEIEHRGWERVGAAGTPRRERNLAPWQALLPHDPDAIAEGDG